MLLRQIPSRFLLGILLTMQHTVSLSSSQTVRRRVLAKRKDASTSLVAHTNPLPPFIQERKAKKSLHKFTFQRSYREPPEAAALSPFIQVFSTGLKMLC